MMCTCPTQFRRQLISILHRVIDPQLMAVFQQSHPFLDAHSETLAFIHNYYTPALLEHRAFQEEFSQDELAAVHEFILRVLEYDRASWPQLVNDAATLLNHFRDC